MSSFKEKAGWGRLLLFLALVIVANQLWCFVFMQTDVLSRYIMHDALEVYPESQIVAIGSSEMLYAVNPEIVEDKLGKTCVTAGSISTALYGGVRAVYDDIVQNEPETVILMVGRFMLTGETKEDSVSYAILAPYLRSLSARWKYYFRVCRTDQKWLERFIMWRDLQCSDIKSNIQEKMSREYQEYCIESLNEKNGAGGEKYTAPTLEYLGKGFAYRTVDNPFNVYDYDNLDLHNTVDFSKEITTKGMPVTQQAVDTLTYIADDCKKRGIRLILAASPIPVTSYFSESYAKVTTKYAEIADELAVEYYDLNLAKEELYDWDSKGALDGSHLNGLGADIYTSALCDIISKADKGENISDLFYTWQERCRTIDDVAAACLSKNGDQYVADAICGENVQVVYKFTKINETKNTEDVLRDYSMDCMYQLKEPLSVGEKIRVYVKKHGDPDPANIRYQDMKP